MIFYYKYSRGSVPLSLAGRLVAKVKTSSAARNMPKCLNRTINAQSGNHGHSGTGIGSGDSYRAAACMHLPFPGQSRRKPREAHRPLSRPAQGVKPTHMSMGHAFHSKFLLFLCLKELDSTDIVRMFGPRARLWAWARDIGASGWVLANIPLLWPADPIRLRVPWPL